MRCMIAQLSLNTIMVLLLWGLFYYLFMRQFCSHVFLSTLSMVCCAVSRMQIPSVPGLTTCEV